MTLIDVSKRPDRHKTLLDEAEAFGSRALICFERGNDENTRQGNDLAVHIQSVPGGDIGWQIVDVAIILCKHDDHLEPEARDHLRELLAKALNPWSDREYGRGNVNHPTIATWLYAAAGKVFNQPDFSQRADENLRRFIHIFSQTGDMSEYNSPTYLGPTLVGLANIGMYAERESTRIRARLIEERIWLSFATRWHPDLQQLAGPHSRAYADSTLGFGGIVRYLAYAVLGTPVFWDTEMAKIYDHNHDAEWAAKIAASVFSIPDNLQSIAEKKHFPYSIYSSTDGEDYTVDGREIYRGGRGSLTTYLTGTYSLGSSERPYLDGGQNENLIAYWLRNSPVRGFNDIRSLYFRYVSNDRLPGQENVYYSWYGGDPKTYSANLLHQDGRQHVLQHKGKAIVLAQPLRRENGYLTSLRFDALIPMYEPLTEIWLGNRRITKLPVKAGWEQPLLIRDGDIYVAFQPLEPTDLGGVDSTIELHQSNRHLILSIYNLRCTEPRAFPGYVLDHTHNGMIIEIGSQSKFESFLAFKNHIAKTKVEEWLQLIEYRHVHYHSEPDDLYLVYSPDAQEVIAKKINGQSVPTKIFECPDALQGAGGNLSIGKVSLHSEEGILSWLACSPDGNSITAVLPTDHASRIELTTPWGVISCNSFAVGRIYIQMEKEVVVEIYTIALLAPIRFHKFKKLREVHFNGKIVDLKPAEVDEIWELS